MKTTKCANGFTLVEILVVMGIMAILAAIVLAALPRVREAGRLTHCTSNLKQLGHAIAMNRSDYDGRYPWAVDVERHAQKYRPNVGPDTTTLPLLCDVLAPYVKNREVWHCPSDTGGVFIGPDTDPPYSSLYKKYGMSYCYYRFRVLSQVYPPPSPSTPPQVPDRWGVNFAILWGAGFQWHQTSNDFPGKRANSLFTDGHVKTETLLQSGYYEEEPIPGEGIP